jgi:toxin YoeB
MIQIIERGGRPGHAELLKGNLSGWVSARIDDENRFIYKVKSDVMQIMSCRGHYTQI